MRYTRLRLGERMEITRDQELARWTIAEGDFEDAKEFLESCSAHPKDSLERQALVMMAVILYARPFSRNERSEESAISRIRVDWFRDLSEDELKLHDRLMDLRNKVIAHAEFTEYPTNLDHESGVIRSRRAQLPDLGLRPERVVELLEKLIPQCRNKRVDYSVEVRRANVISVGGPVERVDGKLVLRIPLDVGGAQLAFCSRGIGEIDGDVLVVVIQQWLAEKLGIDEGVRVIVDNAGGKFNIRRDVEP